MLGEPVVSVIRRELRRPFPELKIESDAIVELLNNEILKREVLGKEKVEDAQLRIRRAVSKNAKTQAKKEASSNHASAPVGDVGRL